MDNSQNSDDWENGLPESKQMTPSPKKDRQPLWRIKNADDGDHTDDGGLYDLDTVDQSDYGAKYDLFASTSAFGFESEVTEIGSSQNGKCNYSFIDQRDSDDEPIMPNKRTKSDWGNISSDEIYTDFSFDEDTRASLRRKRFRDWDYWIVPKQITERVEFCDNLLQKEPNEIIPFTNSSIPFGFRENGVFLVQMKDYDTHSTLRVEAGCRWAQKGHKITSFGTNVWTYKNGDCDDFLTRIYIPTEGPNLRTAAIEYRWANKLKPVLPYDFQVAPRHHGKNLAPFQPNCSLSKVLVKEQINSNPHQNDVQLLAVVQAKAGEVTCNPFSVPHNRRQLGNIKARERKLAAETALIDLLAEQHTSVLFTDVNGKSEKNCLILVSVPSQASMFANFCLVPTESGLPRSAMFYDILYDIGNKFLLVTSLRHPVLRRDNYQLRAEVNVNIPAMEMNDRAVIIGPCVLMTGQSKAEFARAWSLILGELEMYCEAEWKSRAQWQPTFVSDDQYELYQPSIEAVPNAKHLLCILHVTESLKRTLADDYPTCPESERTKTVGEICGISMPLQNAYYPGLVDCKSEEELRAKVIEHQPIWERRHSGFGEKYFTNARIKKYVGKIIFAARDEAGFGDRLCQNNTTETANSMIRKEFELKSRHALTDCEVLRILKRLFRHQERSMAESIVGRGEYTRKDVDPLDCTMDILFHSRILKKSYKTVFGMVPDLDPL